MFLIQIPGSKCPFSLDKGKKSLLLYVYICRNLYAVPGTDLYKCGYFLASHLEQWEGVTEKMGVVYCLYTVL